MVTRKMKVMRSFVQYLLNCYYVGVPACPVGPLQVSDVRSTCALLHWNPPTDDGGRPLVYVILTIVPFSEIIILIIWVLPTKNANRSCTALDWKPIAELRSVICRMGSHVLPATRHRWTCFVLTTARHAPRRDGRLSWSWCWLYTKIVYLSLSQ